MHWGKTRLLSHNRIQQLSHPDNLALRVVWYRAQCMVRCLHVYWPCSQHCYWSPPVKPLLTWTDQSLLAAWSSLYTHRHASPATQSSIKAERLVYVTLDDKNCLFSRQGITVLYANKKRNWLKNLSISKGKVHEMVVQLCVPNAHFLSYFIKWCSIAGIHGIRLITWKGNSRFISHFLFKKAQMYLHWGTHNEMQYFEDSKAEMWNLHLFLHILIKACHGNKIVVKLNITLKREGKWLFKLKSHFLHSYCLYIVATLLKH